MRFHRLRSPLLGLALAALIAGGLGSPAQGADQKVQDWKQAADLFRTYFSDLNSKYSFDGHEAEFLATWETWKKELAVLVPRLKDTYGATPGEVDAAFQGVEPPPGTGNGMRQICQELYGLDLAAKQKEIAGWAAAAGDKAYAKWERYTPPDATKAELKMDYAGRALTHYQRAASIDPAGDFSAGIEKSQAALATSKEAWKKAVGELKWPGSNADFAGPGDPDELAAEALKLLASLESWSKPEYDDVHIPVAACVTGKGWEVTKRNPITEQPRQFSLNFLVAFKGEQDPEVAYAYNMVFYTAEEDGVAKKPPFRFANSRQYAKYRMLMEDVPKAARKAGKKAAKKAEKAAAARKPERSASAPAGVASSGDETASPACGGCSSGWILRLLISVVLIGTGLACAREFLAGKVAALGGIGGALAGAGKPLGLVAILLGLVGFLCSLFCWAPLSDLLPQLILVASGLVLAGSGLPFGLADKLGGVVRPLTARTREIGLAALVLGVLHLILGGFWLI